MEILIQIILAVSTVGSVFAITRYQTAENKKNLEAHESSNERTVESMYKTLDEHSKSIVALQTNQQHNITAKEVREQYISRELFQMHREHIDDRFNQVNSRFDNVDTNLGNILSAIKQKNGGKE